MKLVVLHGPAINNSRQQLFDIKSKFSNGNIVIFETGSDISEVLGELMTISLTPEPRLFILENPPEDFINYPLASIPDTLIFWFDHTVANKEPILDWAKKAQGEIIFFEEKSKISIFPFLDYLATKDKRAYLEIKKLKNSGFDIFYFITMVFYLLRSLAATPKNAPQFVKQKIEMQRKNFSTEQIIKLYKDILEIDFKLKSGLLEKEQAEFLMVNNFLALSL